jgi:hypothetical protein
MAIPMPPEAVDEVAGLEIPNMGVTARAQRQMADIPVRIGLVENQNENSFTNPNRYVQAALANKTQIVVDNWPVLLGQNLPVIISTTPELPPEQHNAIQKWLARGGRLVRFAGVELPTHPDDLLPARPTQILHHSPGTFLHDDPIGLANFPSGSPLQKLRFSAPPKFYQHWLMNADDLADTKIWASYADQTPMILSRSIGQGESIFVTTPPTPSGGDWIFSNAFPQITTKIIAHGDSMQTAPDITAKIQTDQLTVLTEDNLPDNIEIADLNNINGQTPLAHYCFMLAVLLWLADQALIVTRFAGLMRSER